MLDISSGAASESKVCVVSVVVGVLPLPLRVDDDGIRALRPRRPRRHHPEVEWGVVQRGQTRTTRGFPFAPVLDFRFRPHLLPGFECKESISPRPLPKNSARGPCSSSGRARRMWLMTGLYGTGCSSPDDVELGRRLMCKLSDEEMEQRKGMHEPNAIWVMSVYEMGVVIGQESCWVGGKFEGDVIVITCNVAGSPPLKERVVVVQGSAESGVRLVC